MVKRNIVDKRLTLYKTCGVCGKSFITTADTTFVRAMPNPDWSHTKVTYFCSEKCKESTYKHRFDGLEWKRRQEKESKRDKSAQYCKYYHEHKKEMRERRMRQYYAMTDEERAAENAYRRKLWAMKPQEEKDAINMKRRERRKMKLEEANN